MNEASPPPPPPSLNTTPPRKWVAGDFVLGLLAPIVATFVLGAIIPGIGILLGLSAVIAAGVVIGIKKGRWGGLTGALTTIVTVPLIFFVYCLINPPNFH